MTSLPPRVAIPEPTSGDEAYNKRSMPQYVRAVEAEGGTAVPIPLHESPAFQTGLLATCSAILLPGSPADVDPALYGQPVAKECGPRDNAREAADYLLLQDAFAQAKPVLGICYGLQSLNVWRQGSLIQDLPHAEVGITVDHQPGREIQSAHLVAVTPGSRLSSLVSESGKEALEVFVNSSHHQAIDRPGEGLVITAICPKDGVIEALESAEPAKFVVGVQWHPERTYESSGLSRALFAAFLQAARSWSTRSSLLAK